MSRFFKLQHPTRQAAWTLAALAGASLLLGLTGCGRTKDSSPYGAGNPSAKAPAAPGGPPGSGVPGGASSSK